MIKTQIVVTHFTEYKFAAMLSAALSRLHDFPLFVVFNRIPLPPAAQASSYKIICYHSKYDVRFTKIIDLNIIIITTFDRYPTSRIPNPRLWTWTSSKSSVSWKHMHRKVVKFKWEKGHEIDVTNSIHTCNNAELELIISGDYFNNTCQKNIGLRLQLTPVPLLR